MISSIIFQKDRKESVKASMQTAILGVCVLMSACGSGNGQEKVQQSNIVDPVEQEETVSEEAVSEQPSEDTVEDDTEEKIPEAAEVFQGFVASRSYMGKPASKMEGKVVKEISDDG